MTIDPDLYHKPFGFIVRNESWNHKAGSTDYHERPLTAEIMVGQYTRLGGLGGITALGEFAIRWIPLNNVDGAHLEAFDDAWPAFMHPQIQKFIAWMANAGAAPNSDALTSPEGVVDVLRNLGFIDWTARTPPDEHKAEWARCSVEANRLLGGNREESLRTITLLLLRVQELERQGPPDAGPLRLPEDPPPPIPDPGAPDVS